MVSVALCRLVFLQAGDKYNAIYVRAKTEVLMLISVHIPKTGGSSFRKLLQSHYQSGFHSDLSDKPMSTGTLLRYLKAFKGMLRSPNNYEGVDCIHGHFLPIKYKRLPNSSYVIWLRDPVEHIISRYYHFKRHVKPTGKQFQRYIKNLDISIEEFVCIPHYQNMYSKFLFGMKLEQFSFVGITERYEASLKVFCKQFDIPFPDDFTPARVNPNKPGVGQYEISDHLRDMILRGNKRDVDLYNKALEMNERLQSQYL